MPIIIMVIYGSQKLHATNRNFDRPLIGDPLIGDNNNNDYNDNDNDCNNDNIDMILIVIVVKL